ncbi:hypothetical protein HY637_02665 [Candidatus Woesearchaeota archaeon]|nr:hypothetical protein [Candidatus Woesearchaeota archaeon]
MSLEDKVQDKESKGFMRKAGRIAWKLGMAAATTALSMYTLPLLGASATFGIWVGSAFAGGGAIANLAKGESVYNSIDKGLTTYSAVNAVISPMVWLGNLTFPLIPNEELSGKILRGLYASTLYHAAFVTQFKAASHLTDNYLNPIGITKTIGDGFGETWFKVGLLFSPFYFMASNGLTQIAFQNFYVPKLTPYGIEPHYVSRLVAPTFAVGALPASFLFGMWENGKSAKPHGSMAYAPAH